MDVTRASETQESGDSPSDDLTLTRSAADSSPFSQIEAGLTQLEAAVGRADPDPLVLTSLSMSLEVLVRDVEHADHEGGEPEALRLALIRERLDAARARIPGGDGARRTTTLHGSPDAAAAVSEATQALSEALPRAGGAARVLVGRALTAAGLVAVAFIAFEFGMTNLYDARTQPRLLAEFKTELSRQTVTGPDLSAPKSGSPVAVISIPKLGTKKVVVQGTTPDDLKNGPGHFRTTPLPGQSGNAAIAGRRSTYGSPFRNLDDLSAGDEIDVTTAQGVFRYFVRASHVVGVGDDAPLGSTTDNRLTLVTADPAFLARSELVVVAGLQGDPFPPSPIEGPSTLSNDEKGLSGNGRGAAGIALWGEALLLVAAATWLLYRRWSGWSTYLVTTPILIALLVLVFENFDRLLPSTL